MYSLPRQYLTLAGSERIVKSLLDGGAGVNVANCAGCTPLHFAAGAGRLELLKALLEAGAKVNLRDQERATCLHHSIDLASFELLLENGANPNLANDQQTTPLIRVADEDVPEAIALLWKFGARESS